MGIDDIDAMASLSRPEKVALAAIMAIGAAIRELGTVPSGHLYARVMGYLTLDQYNRIIGILKASGKVTESNNLLSWKE